MFTNLSLFRTFANFVLSYSFFFFFFNELKDFCYMFTGTPCPLHMIDLTCKPALPFAESANAGEQCGV
jgi:hypothetical protein